MNLSKFLLGIPHGTVLTSSYLKEAGFYTDLVKVYRRNGALRSIARGAFVKYNDSPTLEGALGAVLRDGYSVHVGGESALTGYHGVQHYLKIDGRTTLFSQEKQLLPAWFKKVFSHDYSYYPARLFTGQNGVLDHQTPSGTILIASPERAFLELLSLVPKNVSVQDAYNLLELLPTLHPKRLQQLLESCTSIKVKRLFLYLASRVGHEWYHALQRETIHLGTSVYQVTASGRFVSEFNLIVDEVNA